jgi:hypothetical protein
MIQGAFFDYVDLKSETRSKDSGRKLPILANMLTKNGIKKEK